ncbi:MAG: helix-turn-helix transcriptional regulator [Acidimicrobiales bacterium]
MAPHIAEGLRRALLLGGMMPPSTGTRGPGVIVLDEDMAVTSMNAEAERWMAELVEPAWIDLGHGALPAAVFAAAAAMARRDADDESPLPTVRLRALGGRWLTLHASPLGGRTSGLTAVVLEAARPADVASIYLDVLGLTPAQTRVASLVLQGRSTQQIVNELQISSHTVQEHLRAVFDKLGVASRREVVATLLGDHH